MSDQKCPCCGQALPGDMPMEALKDANLRPTARLIVDELIRIYPRGASGRQLADRVYALDPNGGPDSGDNVIAVHLTRARPVLRRLGWTVGADRRRGQIRLQRVEASN